MKVKHTKGPWNAMPPLSNRGWWIQGPSTDATEFRTVADISTWDTEERQAANARLIAAAPEMFAALTSAMKTFELERHPKRPWHQEAIDALLKAKGE